MTWADIFARLWLVLRSRIRDNAAAGVPIEQLRRGYLPAVSPYEIEDVA